MSSIGLYASCAQALALAQAKKDDLVAILDPEHGFAPKLRQICREQLADFETDVGASVSTEEIEALKLESDTWGLLQAIMPLRKMSPPSYPSAQTLLTQNPYTPTASLANAILQSSTLLQELVVVREWLHETCVVPQSGLGPGATTGYWTLTKNRIMQGVRMGGSGTGVDGGKGKEREGAVLVSELDPDAPLRDSKTLDTEDAAYDKALVQALYTLVRAGRLEEAIELCRKANQPWRAASIRGSLLFQWGAISTEPRDEDAMDEGDEHDSWRGNQKRKLWKSTCTRAALNSNLSIAERALYAALAPSPKTLLPLKEACHTWSDHLWAQVSVICEEKESAELGKLKGSFWEGSLGSTSANDVTPRLRQTETEWEQEVVKSLSGLSSIAVEQGPVADSPYHSCQLYIILDQLDSLLEKFADGLQRGDYDPTLPEYPSMTRFLAHLCLFLQIIDVSSPPLATQTILEAYLQVLEAAGQRDLIAMYAGALGDNAVERYAMFLTSLELSTDIQERKLALMRAMEHGLDMERVAIVTAERTIEKAFSELPPAKGPLPNFLESPPPPSEMEQLLVRSIEWTTFTETTYDTTLEQANVILRYFLAVGRVKIAKTVLDMLPRGLSSMREPEDRAMEYMHYKQFFIVWEAVERVIQSQSVEVSHIDKESRLAWLEDYRTLVDQAREQAVKLLTTEWLVSDVEKGNGDRRRRELIRIRQIYIPELIIRLHTILFVSRTLIPDNLKYALTLPNVVADSRYKLYDDFTPSDGRRLGDYLDVVREAVLGGLEGGGSDPFRVLYV
ncbi:hypothetical protein NLI96_g12576 [Meripilus lineatus]|uniref:Nuclear pore complex protein n=1 Tax=Meripilus lineatus TaxID=2056292 RepID=A0AAD5Y825_9APHY|nr:hypothetical protein NLI96_g12576 [Physisporinus lineatus]